MHHPGPSPAAASHVPAGGVRADAGMLAEGTTHEEEHQGHPHPPPELGQGIACLPGYPRLGALLPRSALPDALLRLADTTNLLAAAGCHDLAVLRCSDSINKTGSGFRREAVCTSPSTDSVNSLLALSLSLSRISFGFFLSFALSPFTLGLPCFVILSLSP